MKYLAPYSENRPERDREKTDRLLQILSRSIPVIRANMLKEGDLWEFYVDNWGHDDILTIEHDIVFELPMISALVDCPHPICAQNYYLYHLDPPVSTHRHSIPPGSINHGFEPIKEGDEWADAFGMGLTKISLEVQKSIDIKSIKPNWRYLDALISVECQKLGIQCHVHWPSAQHQHSYA